MNNKNNNNLELLSPAGNLEKMKTAIAHGADAVYAGIPDFSLRVRINDFDFDKIKEATEYCHKLGKKIYITVNIFAHNKHLDKLPAYINKLKEIKVDALIASDPGVINLIKEVWKKVEIHLSTQANCTNWQSAKFWYKQGIKRIILGREVTLDEIREIHEKVPEVDLEYFVHGAMCMAYSGRCFLSKYYMNRSGNLGDCIQPCRWNFKTKKCSPVESIEISEEKRPEEIIEIVEEDHGSYILNSKDLCLLQYIKDLKKAGVTSFKIEGRAKSVYYQAVVASIYSRVLKNIDKINEKEIDFLYNELLTKIIHRGYTEGFLLGGKGDQNIDATHNSIDWEFCGVAVKNISKSVNISVKVHNTLKVGDEVEIIMPNYDIMNVKIDKMINVKKEEEISEAHGGAGVIVGLEVNGEVPGYSVLRRKIK